MNNKQYKWESSSMMIKSATEELVKKSIKDGWAVSVFASHNYFTQLPQQACILKNSKCFDQIMWSLHQVCFDGASVEVQISKGNKTDICSILLNQGSPDQEICHSHKDNYISDWCFKTNNGQKKESA